MREYWWPRIKPRLRLHSAAGALPPLRAWFDSGHLPSLSLAAPLHTFLGQHRTQFIRLRRKRLDVAWSKTVSASDIGEHATPGASVGGPCSAACVWCLCPLDAATICQPAAKQWHRLTVFQQFLWEVDEVECQWQSLLASRPELQYIDIDWEDEVTAQHLRSIATFVELGPLPDPVAARFIRPPPQHNPHINAHVKPGGRQKNMTELLQQDQQYRTVLEAKECNAFYCTFG